jgi:hypothetical protein
MFRVNLENKQVQDTLMKIGITTKLPNGYPKSFSEVMIDLSNIFKNLQAENKMKRKEIIDKFYLKSENGTPYQIHCYERDMLENIIKTNKILMVDVCQKLAGVRNSNKLHVLLNKM